MGMNNVPAFLTKIWQLVEDPSTDEMIAWDASGASFHVYDQARFAKEILPLYFKHNNMASFIRQLNMYGFRKAVHIDSGSIKCESDDVEFHHPYFVRGNDQLLENIKRKASMSSGTTNNVKTEPGLKLNQEDVTRVLNDVQLMKGKQENMSSKMETMKKENEALWREVANLRNKHMKQQQIVNKLIQFMIHLVGGNSGLSGASLPKRKMPLMLNDASQVVQAKRPRYNKQLSIEELQDPQYVVKSPASILNVSGNNTPNTGPVIQEVVDFTSDHDSPAMQSHTYSKLPSSSISTTDIDPDLAALIAQDKHTSMIKPGDELSETMDSTDLNNLLQVVDPSQSSVATTGGAMGTSDHANTGVLDKYMQDNPLTDRKLPTVQIPKDLLGHVDTMDADLEGLKDLLSGSGTFDTNALLSLFNGETAMPASVETLLGDADPDGVQASTSTAISDPNTITGNELIQFHPNENFLANVTDLSDIIDDSQFGDSYLSSYKDDHPHAVDSDLLVTPECEPIDPMSFINTGK